MTDGQAQVQTQKIAPCARCQVAVRNDGIPRFYASTESDAVQHTYPAKIVCEQCRGEVRCGVTYDSAVDAWNRAQELKRKTNESGTSAELRLVSKPPDLWRYEKGMLGNKRGWVVMATFGPLACVASAQQAQALCEAHNKVLADAEVKTADACVPALPTAAICGHEGASSLFCPLCDQNDIKEHPSPCKNGCPTVAVEGGCCKKCADDYWAVVDILN